MGKLNDLLSLRLRPKESKSKMIALAEKAQSGQLSSFSGIFRITELSEKEKESLSKILETYRQEGTNVEKDFDELITITSEVKAITNQAVILHGERIKKAQELLKSYKDGAFSAWLLATYGNRQTPYNFLQYYQFYISMPEHLHKKIDAMPRQAIYTLASREGEKERKEEIIEKYNEEPKQVLLSIIRKTFPLENDDKRQPNTVFQVIDLLKKSIDLCSNLHFMPTERQKNEILVMLNDLKQTVTKK